LQDEEKYEKYADAIIRMAEVVFACVKSGEAGRKDLSQIRMQMRGIILQVRIRGPHAESISIRNIVIIVFGEL
jgi:hypothetical protein